MPDQPIIVNVIGDDSIQVTVSESGVIAVNVHPASDIAVSVNTAGSIPNASANSILLGSGTAGVGLPYGPISLGTNLSMSGTTLNAAGESPIVYKTANYTAVDGEIIAADTRAVGSFTVTLPATPADGETVWIWDTTEFFGSAALSVSTGSAAIIIISSIGSGTTVNLTRRGDLVLFTFSGGLWWGIEYVSGVALLSGDLACQAVQNAIKQTAISYTVGTTQASELYGGVIYVSGACTISLPSVATLSGLAQGANFTVYTIGAVAVSVDPDASDLIVRDGTPQADGEKITNLSTAGDAAKFTFYDATGWYAQTNGWSNGG